MGERIMEAVGETRESITLHGLDGLQERAGQEVGTSPWRTVEQDDIDTFAKLTGDEQWIHVDPERARTGPFGATVQHGFLTLGHGDRPAVGRGHGRRLRRDPELRPEQGPVPRAAAGRSAGSACTCRSPRSRSSSGGAEAVYRLTYEVEGEPKPCCVADLVFRYYA